MVIIILVTCFTVFDNNSSTIPHKWIIFSNATDAATWYVFNVVLIEFMLAQCPKSMRGTMIGFWFCVWFLRWAIQFALFYPFLRYIHVSPEVPLGRGFFFLVTQAIVTLLLLLIYMLLAKRYKLRVREVEINIHQIAEDHTIKNIEQEEYWEGQQ